MSQEDSERTEMLPFFLNMGPQVTYRGYQEYPGETKKSPPKKKCEGMYLHGH